FARIREEHLDEPALKQLFTTALDTTALIQEQVQTSQVWQLARQHTNICLNLTAGRVYAARVEVQRLNELFGSLTNARAELSSPLSLTSGPGRESVAATLDAQTVVLAMQTNSAGPSLIASNVSFGNSVSFHFEHRTSEIISLVAAAKTETF